MRRIVFSLLLLCTNPLLAEDDLIDWLLAPQFYSSLYADFGLAEDSNSYSLTYRYDALAAGQWFVSGSLLDDTSSTDENSDQWSVGWRSDYLGDWTIGARARVWGTDNELSAKDYLLSLTYWGKQFSLQITPGYRDLEFHEPLIPDRLPPDRLPPDRVINPNASANSLGVTVQYQGFSVSFTNYDYSSLVDTISSFVDRNPDDFISIKAQDLLFSLEKTRLSAEYRFPQKSRDWGLRYDYSTSAISNTDSSIISVNFDARFSSRWDGFVELGAFTQDDSDPTFVSTFSLGYHW